MKKYIYLLTLIILLLLIVPMSLWAAALDAGGINTFSPDQLLSSQSMNDNFAVVTDAINTSNSLQVKFPAGVSKFLGFYLNPPGDYLSGQGITLIAYWSGCEDSEVRLGYTIQGYSVGINALNVVPVPELATEVISATPPSNFRIHQSVVQIGNGFFNSTTSTNYAFMNFTIGRAGSDSLDACSGDLTLWGAEILYPTNAGNRRVSIPVTSMSR